MNRTKNHYIKYTRNELENYTKHPQTCIKKIKCVEPIRFSPTIISDFQSSILRILSRKIGKYDNRLDGIVLDFRNTRILNTQSGIRQDSAFSTIHVETNFYVFSPQPGANVWGTVKYINRMSMETIISVVIYRVFNVKVAVKGKVKHEFEKDQEIQIRVKNFHFENVIPYIEGEIVETESASNSSKKLFDEVADSGISESSATSDLMSGPSRLQGVKIKEERETSVDPSPTPDRTEKRKRKPSTDSDTSVTPKVKKIKLEPMSSSDDERQAFGRTGSASFRTEKITQNSPEKPKSKRDKLRTFVQSSLSAAKDKPIQEYADGRNLASTSKQKKHKKKTKSRGNDGDDFEATLQMLLNPTQIKKEK